MNTILLTRFIKESALNLGFSLVGIARAEKLQNESLQLEDWLQQGKHGSMKYMENHFEKRIDPTLLMPGAKSVICLGYNYYTPEKQKDALSPKISSYAYGADYHEVLKKKLFLLLEKIKTETPNIEAKICVDSVPVMERQWAARAGLGWTGKNTLLISKQKGSYFFLAEMICNIDLMYDSTVNDYCGTCTACIDACPTNALQPYVLDAQKCISYLTIELKDEPIPTLFKGKMDNWMFGCDVCQQVCPWNRFSTPHQEPEFNPNPELLSKTKSQWEQLDLESFNQLFKNSAVKRTKFGGLKRNIQFLEK